MQWAKYIKYTHFLVGGEDLKPSEAVENNVSSIFHLCCNGYSNYNLQFLQFQSNIISIINTLSLMIASHTFYYDLSSQTKVTLLNPFKDQYLISRVLTPQSLRTVRVLFSPMVAGWSGHGKKFVRAVS